MFPEESSIRVNFARPMPLFPLAGVSLMPHAVLPLHIFEDRYRQMVADALDASGQIAMAVYAGRAEDWADDDEGRPRLRPAVCVGQIVQHHRLPDGRFNIALHGVCRARILRETDADPDGDGDDGGSGSGAGPAGAGSGGDERLYRSALLEPVGIAPVDESRLEALRSRLAHALSETSLADFHESGSVLRHLRNAEVPTSAILEFVSFSLVADAELRYGLLAEGDVFRRARLIESELGQVRGLLDRARLQSAVERPKGVSWN